MKSRRPLLLLGDARLYRKASRASKVDQSVRDLLVEMVATMEAEGGVGLAGPQIGVSLRVFVMLIEGQLYQVVNPEVVSKDGKVLHSEGCLSVPGYVGETARAESITIRGWDQKGRKIRIKAQGGLLAKCIQHEMDHLDGILYLARLSAPNRMRRLPEEVISEAEREKRDRLPEF